jgi:hypothetical protein
LVQHMRLVFCEVHVVEQSAEMPICGVDEAHPAPLAMSDR